MQTMDLWAQAALRIAEVCNSFNSSKDSSKGRCVPLLCSGIQVGIIKLNVLEKLLSFQDVFEPQLSAVGEIQSLSISDGLRSPQQRTVALNNVFVKLKEQDAFPCLRGWRSENYGVGEMFSSKHLLFQCERAAAISKGSVDCCVTGPKGLLGIRQYGVHMNGYIYDADNELKMWIGRRSLTKPTYPGMLDNTVAGGIPAGSGVLETLVQECEEEASMPPELARKAKAVGTISYCHESADGIQPETEFMFDLEVPSDFIPQPLDGEVSQYYLWNIEQIKSEIEAGHFKPNCALVIVNFMIRHGIITPDSEPLYEKLATAAHVDHFTEGYVEQQE